MASLSAKRSQMQFEKISSNTPYQWKSDIPDSGCKPSSTSATFVDSYTLFHSLGVSKMVQLYGRIPALIGSPNWKYFNRSRPSEDVECRFQQLECSVHKMGMVLDSVQNDVIRLNRAMKDASLESNSLQKKAVLLEGSLQEICKRQDDLNELVESCTKITSDQLDVINSHSSNLDEISLTLAAWPKQIQADLRLLQSDISSVLTKETQGIVRAIRSSESRPSAIEMPLKDQSCTINKGLLTNRLLEVTENALVIQTTEVNGRSMVSTTSTENERPPLSQTPIVNERPLANSPVANQRYLGSQKPAVNEGPLMNQKPLANGRPQMKQNHVPSAQLKYSQRENRNPQKSQIPATELFHARSVCPAIEANSDMDVEQGKVKAVRQIFTGSSTCLAPEHDDLSNRQDTHELTTNKEPDCMIIYSDDNGERCISSMILNTETANVDSHFIKEAAEESLQILKRPMKRRGEKKANVPVKASKTARTSDKTGSRVWKRHSGRDRRPSVRFSGPDWYG